VLTSVTTTYFRALEQKYSSLGRQLNTFKSGIGAQTGGKTTTPLSNNGRVEYCFGCIQSNWGGSHRMIKPNKKPRNAGPLLFGRTRQIRTADLYHIKAKT
jgi:hypothetical protein